MQRSEGGLFVDLNSFLAFGREYVVWNYEKTGNSVYLNVKEILKPNSENRPHKKPTLLGIGTISNTLEHFLSGCRQSTVMICFFVC